MRHLLLLSNSTIHGRGYLDHAESAIRGHLVGRARRVLFVPFALHDRDAYAAKVRERLARLALLAFEPRFTAEIPMRVRK